jgi:hypothetical protein
MVHVLWHRRFENRGGYKRINDDPSFLSWGSYIGLMAEPTNYLILTLSCLQIRTREASFAKPWRIGKAKGGKI